MVAGKLHFADMLDGGDQAGSTGEKIILIAKLGILGKLCEYDIDFIQRIVVEKDAEQSLVGMPERFCCVSRKTSETAQP